MASSNISHRGPSLGLGALLLGLAACAAPEPSATRLASPDERSLAPSTEPVAMELSSLEPSRRRAQPVEVAAVTFVPRPIAHELTATIVVRDGSGAPLSTEVFRLSPGRASVADESGAEWWLGRNPLFPEELSGQQGDPARQLVLVYSAGDLRLTGYEQLWDSLARLGCTAEPTAGLRPTGRTESAFGLTFEEWVASDESSPLRELLWNPTERWALRTRSAVEGRSLCREITALEWSVDSQQLREPLQRHPDWLRSGLSDLEDMREHASQAREPSHEAGS